MELNDFVKVIGVWSNGNGPLYRRLAQAFSKAIVQGDIAAHTQLPAERPLATALAISRTTVVAAYDLLQQEEWVESRQGSKTRVRPQPAHKLIRLHNDFNTPLARSPFFNSLFDETAPTIDFSSGTLENLPELPASAFALSQAELTDLLKERGYTALGLPALRRAIANYHSESGLPTTENQILVTTGAQQAISLVAACYLQRGDNVIMENPTYFGAIDALRAAGARLLGLRVGQHGIRPELLRAQMETALPRLIYLQPTFQNPTGTVLPTFQRREIVRLAAEFNVPLVEDNTLADLCLTQDTPPPLASYVQAATIITIGSMSKLFWAGLRVGWIRAPQSLISRLGRVKVVNDLGSSVLNQAIAAHLLPETNRIKTLRREELGAKLELLENLLASCLPDWKWVRPPGGIFLWVKLPTGEASAFAQVALRYGVVVVPGTTMSLDDSHSDYLRLPFSLDAVTLTEGIRRLATAWEAYLPLRETEPRAVRVLV